MQSPPRGERNGHACGASARAVRSAARLLPAATTVVADQRPTSTVAAIPQCRRPAVPLRLLIGEAIADAVHRQQVTRLARIGLELATDVLHVRVDGTFVRLERDAVHRVEQLRACEDPARRARERSEELELRRRELHGTRADAHAHARNVERDLARADDVAGIGWPFGAPKDRADPRDELFRTERLRDVVIRADL